MIIPAVAFIEMAQDALARREHATIADELKEFDAMGAGRLEKVRKGLPQATEFEAGYLLGLETARAMLAMNPAAVQAKVAL